MFFFLYVYHHQNKLGAFKKNTRFHPSKSSLTHKKTRQLGGVSWCDLQFTIMFCALFLLVVVDQNASVSRTVDGPVDRKHSAQLHPYAAQHENG